MARKSMGGVAIGEAAAPKEEIKTVEVIEDVPETLKQLPLEESVVSDVTYTVLRDASVMIYGCGVLLRAGREICSSQYDIEKLLAQGILLKVKE